MTNIKMQFFKAQFEEWWEVEEDYFIKELD
jgi:hypothetical protein